MSRVRIAARSMCLLRFWPSVSGPGGPSVALAGGRPVARGYLPRLPLHRVQLDDHLVAHFAELLADQAVVLVEPEVAVLWAAGDMEAVAVLRGLADEDGFAADELEFCVVLLGVLGIDKGDGLIVE